MNNIISQYQNTFSEIQKVIKQNEDILAAFVFGSMVTGDLWEKSDIDFYIIVKDFEKGVHNVYSDELGPRVHFKVMDKNEFMSYKDFDIKGSFFHRIFSSSRIVICRDEDILKRYNEERFYDDISRQKWTLSYLGKLIKTIDSTDKALNNENFYAAYATCIESMNYFAMVSINSKGYLVSKDNINIACNLDEEFELVYKRLISEGDLEKRIIDTQNYIKDSMDKKIRSVADIIFNYLKKEEEPKSSYEIKTSSYFKDYNIEMEAILSTLYEKKLLKRAFREYKSSINQMLIRENVYLI